MGVPSSEMTDELERRSSLFCKFGMVRLELREVALERSNGVWYVRWHRRGRLPPPPPPSHAPGGFGASSLSRRYRAPLHLQRAAGRKLPRVRSPESHAVGTGGVQNEGASVKR